MSEVGPLVKVLSRLSHEILSRKLLVWLQRKQTFGSALESNLLNDLVLIYKYIWSTRICRILVLGTSECSGSSIV